MTGTFSTVVNFTMLGLLQRMHKLHIQEELQSQTEISNTGMIFPRLKKYGNRKDGSSELITHSVNISNEQIHTILNKADKKAKESITELGMDEILKANNVWDIPPLRYTLMMMM